MAIFRVSNFWIDTATGNLFVQYTDDIDVSYQMAEGDSAYNVYEAQLYLDGQIAQVGAYRPASADGTITGGTYGRTAPGTEVTQPLEDAPS